MAFLLVEKQPMGYTSGPFWDGQQTWHGATVGQVIPLDAQEVLVGRATQTQAHQAGHPNAAVLYLPFPPINRFHARLLRQAGSYELQDLKSRNGTHVNGVRIDSATLNDGDRIGITDFEFVFRIGDLAAAATKTTVENAAPALER